MDNSICICIYLPKVSTFSGLRKEKDLGGVQESSNIHTNSPQWTQINFVDNCGQFCRIAGVSKSSSKWYWKNREVLLARQREKYRMDLAYRERMKAHVRDFYKKNPDKIRRGEELKRLRREKYLENPEKYRAQKRAWMNKNRERLRDRQSENRARNRDKIRARDRRKSELITDAYVREQLSKYSKPKKSAPEWTEAEVAERRRHIINVRSRRISSKRAAIIRGLYSDGQTCGQIAKHFHVSLVTVARIVRNESHYDPAYRPAKIANFGSLSKTLQMIDGASKLEKYKQ